MRILLCFFALISTLQATARSWTGLSGTDLNWSTAGNWNPSGIPVAADALTFDNTCTNCNSTIDTTFSITTVTIAATYPGTLTQSAALTTTGSFSMTGGTFAATSFTVGSSFTFSGGTLAGTSLTLGSSTGSFTCTGNFNAATGIAVTIAKGINAFTLNTNCTLTAAMTSYGGLTIQSSASLTLSGSLPAGGSLTNSGSLTVSGPSFSPNNVTNNNGASIDCSSCSTFTIGALTNNVGGTILYGGSALTVTGNWTQNSTFNISGKALTLGNGSQTFNCTGDFNTVTGVASVTLAKVSNPFTLATGCTLAAAITSVNSVTVQSGASLTTSGTWTGGNAVTNSGTITVTGGVAMAIPGSFTNNSGATFNATSGTTSVTGNWSNAGTFNANGGTVSFTDANHTFTGSTTFQNLTAVTTASARTLTFQAGSTQTIVGTLSLNGLTGKLLSLRSSSSPSIWTIDAQGPKSVSFVDVKDSTATTTIYAGTHSVNSLNNTNWVFTDPPVTFVARHRGGFVMQ